MNNNKVCIVIPIYKNHPTDLERASFRQALTILSKYDICVYTYQGLDLSVYYNEASILNKDFIVEYFDKSYFSSVKGYNRLCLTVDFYKRVSAYKYMLIYQLDAWVFCDELEYWCNKGYDYVGAPWFTNWGTYEDGEELWCVGNGGFSLRNISFFIKMLSYKYPLSYTIDIKNGFRGFVKSIVKLTGFHNTVSSLIKCCNEYINEDFFLTNTLGSISRKSIFHPILPPPLEAARFSFEASPSYLYKLVGRKLPFGCHAFEKYEYETFYKNYISL